MKAEIYQNAVLVRTFYGASSLINDCLTNGNTYVMEGNKIIAIVPKDYLVILVEK